MFGASSELASVMEFGFYLSDKETRLLSADLTDLEQTSFKLTEHGVTRVRDDTFCLGRHDGQNQSPLGMFC